MRLVALEHAVGRKEKNNVTLRSEHTGYSMPSEVEVIYSKEDL